MRRYSGGQTHRRADAARSERSGRPTAGLALVAALSLAGCATQQQVVSSKEDSLAAAGFAVHPANTPKRQAMLNQLPPHHFVQRVHDGRTLFVYADPLVCDCLYVGTQKAYDQYRANQREQNIVDEQEMNAQMYENQEWNWGAWGPWGPGYNPYFGPGVGWE